MASTDFDDIVIIFIHTFEISSQDDCCLLFSSIFCSLVITGFVGMILMATGIFYWISGSRRHFNEHVCFDVYISLVEGKLRILLRVDSAFVKCNLISRVDQNLSGIA